MSSSIRRLSQWSINDIDWQVSVYEMEVSRRDGEMRCLLHYRSPHPALYRQSSVIGADSSSPIAAVLANHGASWIPWPISRGQGYADDSKALNVQTPQHRRKRNHLWMVRFVNNNNDDVDNNNNNLFWIYNLINNIPNCKMQELVYHSPWCSRESGTNPALTWFRGIILKCLRDQTVYAVQVRGQDSQWQNWYFVG